jgi:hypothetical protein
MRIPIIATLSFISLFSSQNSTNENWEISQESHGKTFAFAIGKIKTPIKSGYARLLIEPGRGEKVGTKISLVIESPKILRNFPFDRYEGPVEKSQNEYMCVTVTNVKARKSVLVKPNGYYSELIPGCFMFSSLDPRLMNLLRDVQDGNQIIVSVNAVDGNSILVEFKTADLQKMLKKLM